MGIEIERKFLVRQNLLPDLDKYEFKHIKQAYLSNDPPIRIRVSKKDNIEHGYVTIKSSGATCTRDEFEYKINPDDAHQMIDKLRIGRVIHKKRYDIDLFDLDVFQDEHDGLVVAEIELSDENEVFEKPIWIGDEITHDKRYGNLSLAMCGMPDLSRDSILTDHILLNSSQPKSNEISSQMLELANTQILGMNKNEMQNLFLNQMLIRFGLFITVPLVVLLLIKLFS